MIESSKSDSRNSSIEVLKILAVFCIIQNHVVQSLGEVSIFLSHSDYVIDLSVSSTDAVKLLLTMMRYGGTIGNSIFLICSAWYLIEDDFCDKRKVLQMVLDVWVVSIIFLIIVIILRKGNVSKALILYSLFPNTFNNNWYITCYLLLYLVHPFLNTIIKSLNQRDLLRLVLFMASIYLGIDFWVGARFFSNILIVWITIYFLIAYMKLYLPNSASNFRNNFFLLLIGFSGNFGIVILNNYIGLKVEFLSDSLLRWTSSCSPFIIMLSIGVFNIFRDYYYKNAFVNFVSSLSLLIYIVHENILLRSYYRPLVWDYIYHNFGYDDILFWVVVFVIVVFLFGVISSFLYCVTIKKLTSILVKKIDKSMQILWKPIEETVLKLK